MSVQDFFLVVLHCGFNIISKPNAPSISVTEVSFSFFFNSILKSPANIIGMVLSPSAGTIEYYSKNLGANLPKRMRTNPLQSFMGVLLERYKITIKIFSPFTIHSAAHISPRTLVLCFS
jgi:hypothetical protein